MIYFDNAATTQVYPEVLKTYTEVATKIWGNPLAFIVSAVKQPVFWKHLASKSQNC